MFCSKCGAESPEGAKFCSKCGAELGAVTKLPEGATRPEAESSTGLSANVAGLLCYILGWITGIIFVALEKKSTFVKFHAWQSILTFGVLFVAWLILSRMLIDIGWATSSLGLIWVGRAFGWIVGLAMFIVWIILIVEAGTGKMWKVPWAGDWAEKQISK
jgi:uncharacterized membrane protein